MTSALNLMLRHTIEVLQDISMKNCSFLLNNLRFHDEDELTVDGGNNDNEIDINSNTESIIYRNDRNNNVQDFNTSASRDSSSQSKFEQKCSRKISSRNGKLKPRNNTEDDDREKHSSSEELNPDCSICFRKYGQFDDDICFAQYGILRSCQHSFCLNCIHSWFSSFTRDRWKCPVCRGRVLFFAASFKWLPHNTMEKENALQITQFDEKRLQLWTLLEKELRCVCRCIIFHWRVGVDALHNMIEELVFDQVPVFHRHEIGGFI